MGCHLLARESSGFDLLATHARVSACRGLSSSLRDAATAIGSDPCPLPDDLSLQGCAVNALFLDAGPFLESSFLAEFCGR